MAYCFFTREIGDGKVFTYYMLCIFIILHENESVSNM